MVCYLMIADVMHGREKSSFAKDWSFISAYIQRMILVPSVVNISQSRYENRSISDRAMTHGIHDSHRNMGDIRSMGRKLKIELDCMYS